MRKREEHDQHFMSSFTKDIAPVLRDQIHRFARAASYAHATGQVCDFKLSLEERPRHIVLSAARFYPI